MKMRKKKFQSALLDPPGRWTGNNFLFKGGPGSVLGRIHVESNQYPNLTQRCISLKGTNTQHSGHMGLEFSN